MKNLIYKIYKKIFNFRDNEISEVRQVKRPITKEEAVKYKLGRFNNDTDFERALSLKSIDDIQKPFDDPGSKEKLIFHGMCHACISQKQNGIGRCIGCQGFLPDWSLDNLFEGDLANPDFQLKGDDFLPLEKITANWRCSCGKDNTSTIKVFKPHKIKCGYCNYSVTIECK